MEVCRPLPGVLPKRFAEGLENVQVTVIQGKFTKGSVRVIQGREYQLPDGCSFSVGSASRCRSTPLAHQRRATDQLRYATVRRVIRVRHAESGERQEADPSFDAQLGRVPRLQFRVYETLVGLTHARFRASL